MLGCILAGDNLKKEGNNFNNMLSCPLGNPKQKFIFIFLNFRQYWIE